MRKISFVIDGRAVSAPAETTILTIARREGLAIPTLCHRKDLVPTGSCLLCVVRDRASGRLIPSCATRPVAGQEIETSGPVVLAARRRSVEMLLSDHAGDCEAPCTRACPGGVDIPRMIRQIAAGLPQEAAATMRRRVALPASLSWICSSPCERACRRGRHDGPLAICLLKRYAADSTFAAGDSLPQKRSPSGRRVAVVGSGPAGLSAAWFLLLEGHACTLFEKREQPGGALRVGEGDLPPAAVLELELSVLRQLGADILLKRELGSQVALHELRREFDAVVLATGAAAPEEIRELGDLYGLATSPAGFKADRYTFETSRSGVFAAGSALRPRRHPAMAAAQGRDAAWSLHLRFSGREADDRKRRFNSVIGSLREGEMAEFLKGASASSPVRPGDNSGYGSDEAVGEAQRCLHCDCRKKESCRLRGAAETTEARQRRYGGSLRTPFTRRDAGTVVFEAGKCLRCGLCLQAAAAAGGPGLAFIGRGLEMSVGPAFGAAIAESIGSAGKECATVCPTGAISLRGKV